MLRVFDSELKMIFFLPDYRLVLICSNKDEETSHFISKLHLTKRVFVLPDEVDGTTFKDYLTSKFTRNVPGTEMEGNNTASCSASVVDHEKYVHNYYSILFPYDCSFLQFMRSNSFIQSFRDGEIPLCTEVGREVAASCAYIRTTCMCGHSSTWSSSHS